MNKSVRIFTLLLLSVSLLNGCIIGAATTKKIRPPGEVPEGMARIIFLSPKALYGEIVDVTHGKPILLGVPNKKDVLPLDFPPGQYIFMIAGENGDFMPATLEPNRVYYSLVQRRYGIVEGRYGLWPIRTGNQGDYQLESKKVQKWLKKPRYVKPNPEYMEYWGREKYLKKYEYLVDAYWEKWDEKTPEEKLRRTLLPDDGIPTKYYSSEDSLADKSILAFPGAASVTEPVHESKIETAPDPVAEPAPISAPVIIEEKDEPPSVKEGDAVSIESKSPIYAEKLEALERLLEDGIISQNEYQKLKVDIISSTDHE